MLDRIQAKAWLKSDRAGIEPALHGAQKALAQWAIVDDYNAVLDMHCCDARLLRYLGKCYSLRACGIADDAAAARALRQQAPEAEIFCARKEDIPWRSETFDAVFYQMKKSEAALDAGFLKEAMRVLRPGGQMLVALTGAPEIVSRAGALLGFCAHDTHIALHTLLKRMEEAGLADVSYRMAQPLTGVAIGWKR